MKIWNDEEVVALFDEVEKVKFDKKRLKQAFENHAKNFNRKPNSVRNYYYFELENLKNDEKRQKNLKIDLKKHEKTQFLFFNKDEEEKIIKQIDELVDEGCSVRNACLKLSNGDLKLMTRLINKYQNLKRKEAESKKIIRFEKRQKTLTESDINSLFMGLVKLIKSNANESLAQELESTRLQAQKLRRENEILRQMLAQSKRNALEKFTRRNVDLGKENV